MDQYLIIFVALLLAFILCSFLGKGTSWFYNTNTREGMETADSTTTNEKITYYGPNGATATYDQTTSTLTVIDGAGNTTTYNSSSNNGDNVQQQTLYGENGASATIITNANGGSSIIFTDSNGEQTAIFNTQSGKKGVVSNKNYDNYNHFDGSTNPIIFYGPDGSTLRIVNTSNQKTIVVTNKEGTTTVYYMDKNQPDSTKYVSKQGGTATIVTASDDTKTVEVTTKSGDKIVYHDDAVYAYDSSTNDVDKYTPNTAEGGGSSYNTAFDTSTYTAPNDSTITTVTGPSGNTAVSTSSTPQSSSEYYNSLPPGIPKSQIPPGNEDLYILKSQVVPPVCPACPTMQCPDNFDASKCPPCEPCGRCPEPSFDCKKVPNYNAFNQNTMPVPVLNSFSSFGM